MYRYKQTFSLWDAGTARRAHFSHLVRRWYAHQLRSLESPDVPGSDQWPPHKLHAWLYDAFPGAEFSRRLRVLKDLGWGEFVQFVKLSRIYERKKRKLLSRCSQLMWRVDNLQSN